MNLVCKGCGEDFEDDTDSYGDDAKCPHCGAINETAWDSSYDGENEYVFSYTTKLRELQETAHDSDNQAT